MTNQKAWRGVAPTGKQKIRELLIGLFEGAVFLTFFAAVFLVLFVGVNDSDIIQLLNR